MGLMMKADFEHTWDHENQFYLTCEPSRIGKLMAHFELYKQIVNIPGYVAEFGVFKGASFSRFCMLRELLESSHTRRIIGFDTFDAFPDVEYDKDKRELDIFFAEAGKHSISIEALRDSLVQRDLARNIELIKGDICITLPEFIKIHPEARFALVNLDVDLYEPSHMILEHVWNRIMPGGVLILDNYSVFPGETRAVEELLGRDAHIKKFPYAFTPYYLIKGE